LTAEPTRLLVVDDDDPHRSRLARALRERGLEVAEARSAAEALEVARSFRPDRAVLDLRLPDRSGIDLLSDLRAAHPELACVVLTGFGSIPTAVEAVRRSAVDYLTKPADADEILRAFETGSGDGPDAVPPLDAGAAPSLHRVEWEHIQRVLAECGGNVSRAARVLGLHRRTLQRKLATRPPQR
jgi:two-component system response regulator RegA